MLKLKFVTFCMVAMHCIAGGANAQAKVLIVYHSVDGHTKTMAEAVADGAKSIAGIDVVLKNVTETSNKDVITADAIILGSPVYNANVTPEMQTFINGWPFEKTPLKDKIGAAFVTAGGMSAGEELVQLNLLHSMLMFGMVIVGGGEWTQAFGASAIVEEPPFEQHQQGPSIPESFIKKGKILGKRVSEMALKMNCRENQTQRE